MSRTNETARWPRSELKIVPSDASLDQGWISLFDGETLYGWKAQTEVDWHVTEGTIKATAGKSGLLRTTAQFSNYELSVDFKATAETNSGVFLRTSPKPKSAAKDCYEINIDSETNKFPTGGVVARVHPLRKPHEIRRPMAQRCE